jgi:hypothetical protein
MIILVVGLLLLISVKRASRITRNLWVVVSSLSALVFSAMMWLNAEAVSPSDRALGFVLLGVMFLCVVGMLFMGIRSKDSRYLEAAIPCFVFSVSVLLVFLFGRVEVTTIDLSERIASVSDGLNAVSTELSEIQTELEARVKLVEDLKEQEETSKAVMELSKEQMEMLDRVLDRQGSESTRVSVFTMVGGALLGFLLGQLPSVLKRWRKKPTGENDDDPFYSKENQERITQAIERLEAGQGVEHEPIETDSHEED